MNNSKALSCKRFVFYAITLSVLFTCTHMLGFREYTSVLSGTASFNAWSQYCGVLYLLLYLSFVVIIPILLISSIFLAAFKRLLNFLIYER